MTPLRLALVTRRFWPLVGGAEILMANLAAELRRRGASTLILTAQWEREWPKELVHREVPVYRLPNPPQRGWGTLRYMLALARWLRRHASELDLVYVSMLKHDAYAALGALRPARVPVVLRAEGGGPFGDCRWQETANWGGRIRQRCRQADAVVAPSRRIAEELQEAGYQAERIRFIPNGVAVGAARSYERRRAARQTLAETNHDLATGPDTPVAVYTGRLDEEKGLLDLIQAWPLVLARRRDARLWLVGEGPLRDTLFRRIRDAELQYAVFLPGAFDQVDEILHAADAFVLPSYQEGMSLALLEALAVGLPCVASDIPGNRLLIEPQTHGLLVPPRQPGAWATTILDVFSQPAHYDQMGARGRAHVQTEFSLERTAEQHLALFHNLVEMRNKCAPSPSP